MLCNRSIPCVTVIPVLGYPDVDKALKTAADWPPPRSIERRQRSSDRQATASKRVGSAASDLPNHASLHPELK
jgi:hypothetical protein